MDLTHLLSHVFGFYLLIIGCLFLFKPRDLARTMSEFAKSEALLFLGGIVGVTAGLLIVFSHNIWDGDTITTVVTILGWAILLKGLAVIFLPQQAVKAWTRWSNVDTFSYFYGLVTLLFGLYLIFG